MKNKIVAIVIVAVMSALLVSPGFAQEPSASPASRASKQPFQMPDMSETYSKMMNATYTELLRPERAAALAHFQKLYYDALVKEGFTKDEALSILRAHQLPMAGLK